jgi:CBS domain-containing protein
MSTVEAILATKGTTVWTIPESATVLDAAKMMNQRRIGCLVVTRDDGVVNGIVAERDLLRHAVDWPDRWFGFPVREVMTTDVVVCRPADPLNRVRSIMKTRWLRQIPVVDDEGALLGIVSIGDTNAHLLEQEELEIQYLHDYIHGRVR